MTIGFFAADPKHLHERADDIRLAVTLINDASSKARMIKIADGYEVLARQIAGRQHTGKLLSTRKPRIVRGRDDPKI